MCQVVHQSGGCSSKGMQQEGKFADEGEGGGNPFVTFHLFSKKSVSQVQRSSRTADRSTDACAQAE